MTEEKEAPKDKRPPVLEAYIARFMQPITQELIDNLREDPYPCQIVTDFMPNTNDRDTFGKRDGILHWNKEIVSRDSGISYGFKPMEDQDYDIKRTLEGYLKHNEEFKEKYDRVYASFCYMKEVEGGLEAETDAENEY